MVSKQKKASYNLILPFAFLTACLFGLWKHSTYAGAFMFGFEAWVSHLYAYVHWDERKEV